MTHAVSVVAAKISISPMEKTPGLDEMTFAVNLVAAASFISTC